MPPPTLTREESVIINDSDVQRLRAKMDAEAARIAHLETEMETFQRFVKDRDEIIATQEDASQKLAQKVLALEKSRLDLMEKLALEAGSSEKELRGQIGQLRLDIQLRDVRIAELEEAVRTAHTTDYVHQHVVVNHAFHDGNQIGGLTVQVTEAESADFERMRAALDEQHTMNRQLARVLELRIDSEGWATATKDLTAVLKNFLADKHELVAALSPRGTPRGVTPGTPRGDATPRGNGDPNAWKGDPLYVTAPLLLSPVRWADPAPDGHLHPETPARSGAPVTPLPELPRKGDAETPFRARPISGPPAASPASVAFASPLRNTQSRPRDSDADFWNNVEEKESGYESGKAEDDESLNSLTDAPTRRRDGSRDRKSSPRSGTTRSSSGKQSDHGKPSDLPVAPQNIREGGAHSSSEAQVLALLRPADLTTAVPLLKAVKRTADGTMWDEFIEMADDCADQEDVWELLGRLTREAASEAQRQYASPNHTPTNRARGSPTIGRVPSPTRADAAARSSAPSEQQRSSPPEQRDPRLDILRMQHARRFGSVGGGENRRLSADTLRSLPMRRGSKSNADLDSLRLSTDTNRSWLLHRGSSISVTNVDSDTAMTPFPLSRDGSNFSVLPGARVPASGDGSSMSLLPMRAPAPSREGSTVSLAPTRVPDPSRDGSTRSLVPRAAVDASRDGSTRSLIMPSAPAPSREGSTMSLIPPNAPAPSREGSTMSLLGARAPPPSRDSSGVFPAHLVAKHLASALAREASGQSGMSLAPPASSRELSSSGLLSVTFRDQGPGTHGTDQATLGSVFEDEETGGGKPPLSRPSAVVGAKGAPSREGSGFLSVTFSTRTGTDAATGGVLVQGSGDEDNEESVEKSSRRSGRSVNFEDNVNRSGVCDSEVTSVFSDTGEWQHRRGSGVEPVSARSQCTDASEPARPSRNEPAKRRPPLGRGRVRSGAETPFSDVAVQGSTYGGNTPGGSVRGGADTPFSDIAVQGSVMGGVTPTSSRPVTPRKTSFPPVGDSEADGEGSPPSSPNDHSTPRADMRSLTSGSARDPESARGTRGFNLSTIPEWRDSLSAGRISGGLSGSARGRSSDGLQPSGRSETARSESSSAGASAIVSHNAEVIEHSAAWRPPPPTTNRGRSPSKDELRHRIDQAHSDAHMAGLDGGRRAALSPEHQRAIERNENIEEPEAVWMNDNLHLSPPEFLRQLRMASRTSPRSAGSVARREDATQTTPRDLQDVSPRDTRRIVPREDSTRLADRRASARVPPVPAASLQRSTLRAPNSMAAETPPPVPRRAASAQNFDPASSSASL